MEFLLTKLLWVVAQPSNLLFILLALSAFASLLRPYGQGPRRSLVAVVLLVLVLGLLPVGRWISLPLEERFQRPAMPAQVDGVIVLGGALRLDISADRVQPSLNEHAERMTEAVRLARLYPEARMVFTGGSGAIMPGRLREAEVARELFADLGLHPDRILFEDKSRNTRENARFSLPLANPKPGETWLLLTSALHMPRAMASFRGIGWQPLPWPVDYQTGRDEAGDWRFAPIGQLRQLDRAAHEWLGLLGYRLLGWSGEIFPDP